MFTSVISVVTRKPSNCTGLGLTISATSFIVKMFLAIVGTMAGIGYILGCKLLFYSILCYIYNLSFVSERCACRWWHSSCYSRMVCTVVTIYSSNYVNVYFFRTNTFTIMGFIWSYLLDDFLQNIDIDEVRVAKSSVPETKKLLP